MIFRHSLDGVSVCFYADGTFFIERQDRVGQKIDRLQEIVDDHRFEHIEFKISLAGRKADRRIVAQHLTRPPSSSLRIWVGFTFPA